MTELWKHAFDAGVKASEKALDRVIRLAYKDGFNAGYLKAIEDKKDRKRLTSLLYDPPEKKEGDND